MSTARASTPRLRMLVVLLIAGLLLVMALEEAVASPSAQSVAAIIVWWGLALALGLGVVPRGPVPRPALVCTGLLLALALLSGVSSGWAPSAERSFEELDRLLLYAGLLAAPALLCRAGDAARWCDGLAVGTALAAVVGLGQRLLPGVFGTYDLGAVLPDATSRLSYPIGYWNGLAVFVALGVPLLLRAALRAQRPVARAAAVGALPVVATTIYLTSSRGGVAVAVIAALLFVVLCGEGLRALIALVAGGLGALVAVLFVHGRPVLVDGPFGTGAAAHAGRVAALVVLACCLGSALLFSRVGVLLPVLPALTRRARSAVAAGSVALTLVALVAIDLPARIREFKAPPPANPAATAVGAHLASGGGSGRWQFWQAALDQFSAHPLAGGGAGSFEPWWTRHGSLDWFVRNAHSLWLETLGELGVLGFALIVAVFVVAAVAGVRRLTAGVGAERATVAALLAVLAGFALGAALDWVWQLPAVAALALLAIGLLTGPATAPPSGEVHPVPWRRTVRIAAIVVAGAVIVAQGLQLLGQRELEASRSAAARDDLPAALDRARSAAAIEPWAATPRAQQALVLERAGQLRLARAQIAAAIARDGEDWRLEVIAARLAVKSGDVAAARRALARARSLNPRSRILPRGAARR